MWPPTIRVRPSGSCTWPPQNRFRPYGTDVKMPVCGFHSRSEFRAAPKPSSEKTSPVDVSDMWTATIGHANGALQSPMTLGGSPGAALEPPS